MRFKCGCGKWLCTTCPDPAPVDTSRRFFLMGSLFLPVAASVTVAPALPSFTWQVRFATFLVTGLGSGEAKPGFSTEEDITLQNSKPGFISSLTNYPPRVRTIGEAYKLIAPGGLITLSPGHHETWTLEDMPSHLSIIGGAK